ncbi:MAG: S8 family serine peptidase [Ignavibacteriae bacterium]|nr:S8 family serine peptidase [Ignavibacteriota bacterium]
MAYAYGLGAIIVIAAGNNYSEYLFYPASYPKVISVASVGVDDRKANYSNYGIGVDISAPGGDYGNGGGILSTIPYHSYASYQGTSMACPVAASCLGLLKAYHPNWSKDSLISQFFATTDNIDSMNANYINKLGAGRVNPYRSLTESEPILSKKLKLTIYNSFVSDSISNNNGIVEPGDSINIGFTIRNYSHLISSNSVKFTIESPEYFIRK